ncbi:hypothetical protein PsorP6_012132 [Peronosclerospora sorghi]|uniref:Uncharacterized protein n=1 Tax=Peronosclerospora sorghi TaxID=230839 RepID=A0ACC0WJ40_9STRA|nr:hypothetical protein PsorP6_012132 [Peronosclerospora sorghi]
MTFLVFARQPSIDAEYNCSGSYTRIWGLTCKHAIHEMLVAQRPLQMSDVHTQWHIHCASPPLPTASQPCKDQLPDLLDQVAISFPALIDHHQATVVKKLANLSQQVPEVLKEPPSVRVKGRPRKKEDSTRREPSGFEYVEPPITKKKRRKVTRSACKQVGHRRDSQKCSMAEHVKKEKGNLDTEGKKEKEAEPHDAECTESHLPEKAKLLVKTPSTESICTVFVLSATRVEEKHSTFQRAIIPDLMYSSTLPSSLVACPSTPFAFPRPCPRLCPHRLPDDGIVDSLPLHFVLLETLDVVDDLRPPTKLTAFSKSSIHLAPDDPIIELCFTQKLSTCFRFRVRTVFDKTEATGRLFEPIQSHNDALDVAHATKQLVNLNLRREKGQISHIQRGGPSHGTLLLGKGVICFAIPVLTLGRPARESLLLITTWETFDRELTTTSASNFESDPNDSSTVSYTEVSSIEPEDFQDVPFPLSFVPFRVQFGRSTAMACTTQRHNR